MSGAGTVSGYGGGGYADSAYYDYSGAMSQMGANIDAALAAMQQEYTGQYSDLVGQQEQLRAELMQNQAEMAGALESGLGAIDQSNQSLWQKMQEQIQNILSGMGTGANRDEIGGNYVSDDSSSTDKKIKTTVDAAAQVNEATRGYLKSEREGWYSDVSATNTGMGTSSDNTSFKLRDYFEKLGYAVGYDQATGEFSVGGVRFDSSGFQNKNNWLYATSGQLDTIQQTLQKAGASRTGQYDNTTSIGLRNFLTQAGHKVDSDYTDPSNPYIIVDGKRYSAKQFQNVNGSLYGTRAQIYNVFGI